MWVDMKHKKEYTDYPAPRWKFIHSRTVHDMEDLPDAGGVYFGYNQTPNGNLRLTYIGQSHNIRQRLLTHHGSFTHIMIYCFEMDRNKRLELEKHLIKSYGPPENIQHSSSFYVEEEDL